MTDSRQWLLLIFFVFFSWALYLLAPILTPFLISTLLAYMGDPLVDRLELKKVPRVMGVIIVFLIMFLVLLCLFIVVMPKIEQQVVALIHRLPEFQNTINQYVLPWLHEQFSADSGQEINFQEMIQKHWKDADSLFKYILSSVTQSGTAIINFFANLVLIPVVTFYLLRDWDILLANICSLLPESIKSKVIHIAQESDSVLSAFMRGQILVMLCLGVIYTTGLWIAGIELALLIGMMAGLVSFVPYLGFILGIITASVAALMQFHDFSHLFPVFFVFGLGQLIEGMLLTPLFVGERIGLHPVAVIFAVMAGAQLYGFFGVLLALPVAAVIMVLLRFGHQHLLEDDVCRA